MKYRIGVIDDVVENTMLLSINRFSKEVDLVKVPLFEEINEVVFFVIESKLDGLIIDQQLNTSDSNIIYKGTDISYEIKKKRDVPTKFWSSNIENVKENCKSYEVGKMFEQGDTKGDLLEGSKLISELILEIKKLKEEIKDAEDRILELRKIEKNTPEEIEEILCLENIIMNNIKKESEKEKARKTIDIERINRILDELEKNNKGK